MPTFLPKVTKQFSYIILFLSIVTVSCKKNSGKVGLNTDSDVFKGIVVDTFQVNSYTWSDDTLNTSSWPAHPLGYNNDPIFGKTYAGIASQILLPVEGLTFPNITKIDSVKLSLYYVTGTPLYGDSNSLQTIIVSQLSNQIYSGDTVYQSTHNIQTQKKLGTWTGIHNTRDSIRFTKKGTKYIEMPNLNIHLDTNFGHDIVHSNKLATNADFTNYINGIYIEPDQLKPGNVISYINFSYKLSHLTIYYNDSEFTAFPLTIDANAPGVHFNTFKHDYSNAPVSIVRNKFTQYPDVFIQSMAGSKLRLEFPSIENFFKSVSQTGMSIQKAEIVIQGDLNQTQNNLFSMPEKLLLFNIGDNNAGEPILDRYEKNFIDTYGTSYPLSLPNYFFGGNRTLENNYNLIFTRHLQNAYTQYSITQKNILKGLYVTIPTAVPVQGSRMVISKDQIKLKITYALTP